jgi:hypothetical protein
MELSSWEVQVVDEPLAEKTFEVLEGEGWRLGYETAPDSEESFCATVRAASIGLLS